MELGERFNVKAKRGSEIGGGVENAYTYINIHIYVYINSEDTVLKV